MQAVSKATKSIVAKQEAVPADGFKINKAPTELKRRKRIAAKLTSKTSSIS